MFFFYICNNKGSLTLSRALSLALFFYCLLAPHLILKSHLFPTLSLSPQTQSFLPSLIHRPPLRVQRRPQLPDARIQPLLLLPQRVQLLLLPVQPVAQLSRFPQNINLRRPFLLPQTGNLPLQLLKQILQPDPPLPLHIVMQISLLQRLLLLGRLRRRCRHRRR